MTDGLNLIKPNHEARFHLADWIVDTRSNQIRKGNTEIKLESKVMEVLDYLVQRRGELVTREELEKAVWGKTVVGYDALTRCIARLRKALGDDPRQPHYIETISKKGYRLIANIPDEDFHLKADDISKFNGDTWRSIGSGRITARYAAIMTSGILILGMFLVFAFQYLVFTDDTALKNRPIERPSIVVLPFVNLDDDPNQRYFTDGITADITTELSKLSGLFVISQSSANGYRNQPLELKKVAGTLGVRYVLEGNVRRTGDRMRVNVYLIDATTDFYLWTEKYDRELRDVFAVQDDIAANIVNALSVTLTEDEKRRTARRFTTSIEAYEDFLRGQSMYGHHINEDNQQARNFFMQAIDRDESFARAYSAMAMTYVAEHRYGWNSVHSREQLDRALQLARKGVSLDHELPQAYWVLAYVHVFRQEYRDADKAVNRAIELEPNFANSYITLAVCKMHFGEFEEAMHLIRKAMLLNPFYPAAYTSVLGQLYYLMGQYELAVPALHDAVDRNINLLTAQVFMIAALSKLDRLNEASWTMEQLKFLAPDFTADKVAGMLPVQDVEIIDDIKKHLQRVGL